MAAFRRFVIVLAALVVAISTASAQSNAPLCNASSSTPPLLRAEGITELTGDIVLTCSYGQTIATLSTVNFQIFTSAPLTSPTGDPLLLVDEPLEAAQVYQASSSAPVAGANVFQSVPSGTNSVTFLGVPVLPKAAGAVTVYRITNVRVNVTGLAGTGPIPVTTLVTISPSNGLTLNQPNQVVGYVEKSLTSSISAGATYQQCSFPTSIGETITVAELFATAFKTRTVGGWGATIQDTPAQVTNTETGLYGPNAGNKGLAAFGTRIRLVFSNISNVSISVPTIITAGNTTIQLTASETGAFSMLTSGALNVNGGTAEAVYEVTSQDPAVLDSIPIAVAYGYTGPTNTGSVINGPTVNVSYAPTVPPNTLGATIPQFIDSSTPLTTFTIVPCRTNLLFPFLTNIAGYDTGVAIANTSTDPYGTAPQAGNCTLYLYGAGAPATPPTTPTIASGTDFTGLVSAFAPGFQGYGIAVCNFQFGHGFAFVSDGYGQPGKGASQGYLALVIPDNARGPNPLGPAGSGEQLAH